MFLLSVISHLYRRTHIMIMSMSLEMVDYHLSRYLLFLVVIIFPNSFFVGVDGFVLLISEDKETFKWIGLSS